MEYHTVKKLVYRKNPKISYTRKICCNHPKFEQGGSTIMCPKDADGMTNSLDPDQTAPLGL